MVSGRHTSSKVLDYAGPLVYFVGDSLENLQFQFDYEAGGPVVLNASTVNVAVSRIKGNTAIFTGTATLTDANNGFAVLDWGSFTFQSPGTYIGQCEIVYAGRSFGTQRFLIEVIEKVAGL